MFIVTPKNAAMPVRMPRMRPMPTASSPTAMSQPNQLCAPLSMRSCRKLRYHSNVMAAWPVVGIATAPFQ